MAAKITPLLAPVPLQCQNCFMADMASPPDAHPAYLLCPSCSAIELTYLPQDYQSGVHEVDYRYNPDGTTKTRIIFVAGGYGSGKSRSSLTEFILQCLENPGGTGLITAPTLLQLKRTTIKTLLQEVLPPPLIESYNKSDQEIKLVNGFTIYGIPSDDEEKLRSINAGIIHIEEASGIDRAIYDQLLTRMRDPFVSNRTMFVCTNPDVGWVKEVFADNPDRQSPKHPEHEFYNPAITTFIWETSLNKHLPADFIEINSKGKPEWWIQRYLNGSFKFSEGMVYPYVSQTIVEPFDIPKGWERLVCADYGMRNPTAVLFLAIDPKEGCVYLYEEYYVAGRTVPEHARYLKPRLDTIPTGTLRAMVIDPSTRNKTDPVNGKSVQGLFQEYDIFFRAGNNSMEAGILKLNSYINRGKLKIFSSCVSTLREILNYKFVEITLDQAKNPDEKPIKKNDHACDALRYGIMELPDDPLLLVTESHEPPRKYGQVLIKDEDDELDEFGEPTDWRSYV